MKLEEDEFSKYDLSEELVDYQPKKNNMETFSWKKEMKSFAITFVVSFAMVLVAQIDSITISTIESGAIYGILFGAVRAGVKGVLELTIALFSK